VEVYRGICPDYKRWGHLSHLSTTSKYGTVEIERLGEEEAHRPESFTAARQTKIDKYAPVVESLKGRFRKVIVEPVVVRQYGSWDPKNDDLLKKMFSKTYVGLM
jgi:hypothetical protein